VFRRFNAYCIGKNASDGCPGIVREGRFLSHTSSQLSLPKVKGQPRFLRKASKKFESEDGKYMHG